METQPPDKNRSGGGASLRLLAALAVFCALPFVILAQSPAPGPGWWTTYNVVIPSGTANDYGAVNQGQLKNFAVGAYQELQSLPGGVGDTSSPNGTGSMLNGMILSWGTFAGGTFVPVSGTSTNNYAAVNLGQLKNVASLFYNRLAEVGYQSTPLQPGQVYPWDYSASTPNDYAMANIGQVKNLFSFDLTSGTGANGGVPNWWETKYFGSGTSGWLSGTATAPSGAVDGGGDSMTILEAYQNQVNPIDIYNGQTRMALR